MLTGLKTCVLLFFMKEKLEESLDSGYLEKGSLKTQ